MSFEQANSMEKEAKEEKRVEKSVTQMRDIELVEKRGIVPAQFYKKFKARVRKIFAGKSDDDVINNQEGPRRSRLA